MASQAVRKVLILTVVKIVLLLIELLSDSSTVAARIQLFHVPGGMLLVEGYLAFDDIFRDEDLYGSLLGSQDFATIIC
jgi:hypothetical protein